MCFGLDLKYTGAQETRHFKSFNDFWILAIYCNYWYGFKTYEMWWRYKSAIFAEKSQKSPSSWGLCPLCDTLELQRFVQYGT